MMSYSNQTTTPTKTKNFKNNKNEECGEENSEEAKVGDQVFPPATTRSTRSSGKASVGRSRGKSSRTEPYGPATKRRDSRVLLTKMDVVDYKVDKTGTTFRITMGADGNYLQKEQVDPQPGPSGLGSPLLPAAEKTREELSCTCGDNERRRLPNRNR